PAGPVAAGARQVGAAVGGAAVLLLRPLVARDAVDADEVQLAAADPRLAVAGVDVQQAVEMQEALLDLPGGLGPLVAERQALERRVQVAPPEALQVLDDPAGDAGRRRRDLELGGVQRGPLVAQAQGHLGVAAHLLALGAAEAGLAGDGGGAVPGRRLRGRGAVARGLGRAGQLVDDGGLVAHRGIPPGTVLTSRPQNSGASSPVASAST